MLSNLQNHLVKIYRADPGYDVADFLVTDPALARILGGDALMPDTEETVLLAQQGEGIEMSVYLDQELLSRLEGHDPLEGLKVRQLADLWTVLEGISHFNYIAWCASLDKSVTLLELEMQAEVDKFVGTWLLALEQEDRDLADRLHGWLFEDVGFNPALDDLQRERYKAANDFAARFCHGLCKRLRRNSTRGMRELRHFYRLTQPEKISHIHSQSWQQ